MKLFHGIMILGTSILLTACGSSEPTFGDKLKAQGAGTQKIAKQWSEGESMIKNGQGVITEGRKQIFETLRQFSGGDFEIDSVVKLK